jgi:hypothetical protein
MVFLSNPIFLARNILYLLMQILEHQIFKGFLRIDYFMPLAVRDESEKAFESKVYIHAGLFIFGVWNQSTPR